MNFFKTLFTEKLAAMRAAAPRATLRMLHESNGFSLYLDEAAAARKVSQLGTLTDHAEDILEDSVPVLFIPLEQTIKFVEEVTLAHSVALVDVALANRVNNARHTMYAYFPKRMAAATRGTMSDFVRDHWEDPTTVEKLTPVINACIVEEDGSVTGFTQPVEKENTDDDFWG